MNLRKPPHRLRAAVLGAGTMGAAIAAHLANAGVRTTLLDRVAGEGPRSRLATGALQNLLKAEPAPLSDPANAFRIVAGNFDDDLARALEDCDLVIEAVIEQLEVKRALFEKVAALAPPRAILATNTSGLRIAAISAGLPEAARARLVGMHFFNPPRYMHLLEVVPGPATDPAVVEAIAEFSDRVLGKGVVHCRDTPNFVGNRIGIAEMGLSFHAAATMGLTVEEVDLLNGPLMGRPRTGTFRLGDLVGVDIAAHVAENLRAATSDDPAAPDHDELRGRFAPTAFVAAMLERKLLGDKTSAGFYRKGKNERGERTLEALDLVRLEYRPTRSAEFPELAEVARIPELERRAAAALRVQGRAGDFLRAVYLPLFAYAAARVGRICDTPAEIDQAMCWGYGWKLGPFALWDAVGVGWAIEAMTAAGVRPPAAALELARRGADARWYGGTRADPTIFVPGAGPRALPIPEGVLVLDRHRDGELASTASASLLDLGDGVACLEFRSKMNVFDDGVVEAVEGATATLSRRGGFRALVIGNEGDNFSAGADVRRILGLSERGDFAGIEAAVRRFQDMLMGLRHAEIPVVAAPFGMTLGGGAECVLSCAAVEAHLELYMGLVEVGVGLLPAGGGLKELCRRAAAWAAEVPDGDPYDWLRRAFEVAGQGKVSTSAHEARRMGFLAASDGVVFNRRRLLAAAKQRAIALCETGWTAPDPDEPIRVVGAPRGAAFELGARMFAWSGHISEHDHLIGTKIAHVLSGGMTPTAGTVTARRLLELEREAFVSLCGEPKTQARIRHMLETGKPLRN